MDTSMIIICSSHYVSHHLIIRMMRPSPRLFYCYMHIYRMVKIESFYCRCMFKRNKYVFIWFYSEDSSFWIWMTTVKIISLHLIWRSIEVWSKRRHLPRFKSIFNVLMSCIRYRCHLGFSNGFVKCLMLKVCIRSVGVI